MTVKVFFSFSAQDHSLPAAEYNIFTVLPEQAIRNYQHRWPVLRGSEHAAGLCQFAFRKQPFDIPLNSTGTITATSSPRSGHGLNPWLAIRC
jgi:hypothetical protein